LGRCDIATAATIAAKLILDANDYDKGLDDAEKRSSSFASGLGGVGKAIGGVGLALAGVAAAGVAGFGAFLIDSAKSAMDSENAMANLDATLKSTGQAAADQAAAWEAAQGKIVTTSGLSAEKTHELELAQRKLLNQVAGTTEGLAKLAQEHGTDNTVYQEAALKLETLKDKLAKVNGELAAGAPRSISMANALGLTAPAARITKDEVVKLAEALQKTTKFSDEAIITGQSMLLTFTNIGKDVFPDATEAMLNMAEKFGGMDAASIQLGKALNDPIGGVAALRRVGVQLTDAQEKQIKAMVKSGNIMGAQKIILGELKTEFGGLAVAAGATTEGAMIRLNNAFDDVKETVGNALLPLLNDLVTNVLLPLVPQAQALAEIFGEKLTTAVAVLKPHIDKLLTAFSDLGLGILDAFGIDPSQFDLQEFLTTGISDAAGFIDKLTQGLKDVTPQLIAFAGWVKEHKDEILGFLVGLGIAIAAIEISTFVASLVAMVTPLGIIAVLLGLTVGWLVKYGEEILGANAATASFTDKLAVGFFGALNEAATSVRVLGEIIELVFVIGLLRASEAATAIVVGLASIFSALVQSIQDDFSTGLMAVTSGIQNWLINTINAIRAKFSEFQTLGEGLMDHVHKGILMKVAMIINSVIGAVKSAIDAAGRALGEANPFGGGGSASADVPGFADGGIASMPASGGLAVLHGQEAVIPLQGGSIPVQLTGNGGGSGADRGQTIINLTPPAEIDYELAAQKVIRLIQGTA